MKSRLAVIENLGSDSGMIILDVYKVVYVHMKPDSNGLYRVVTINNDTLLVSKKDMHQIVTIMGIEQLF